MEKVRYLSPKESLERGDEDPYHRFELVLEGKTVGAAEVEYFSKPLPHYQVGSLYVDDEQMGKGYASQLMAHIEDWLKERKKPGILIDVIDDTNPAKGMYEKRGWQKMPGWRPLFVYHWPADVDLSILDGYSARYGH